MRRLTKSPRDGRPLAVLVYEELRDRIVEGELPGDSKIVQEQVADSLGVSRTPVREALNRLAHEGLVTWLPGGGYLVNELSSREIVEVYQVRRTLEVEATQLASGRHGAVHLAQLTALIEEMAVADPADSAAQFELNRRFHRALVAPCDNALLLKILDTLWDHPVNRRITRSYVSDAGNVGLMIADHRALAAAAAAGDEERLVELTRHHLSTGYDEALQATTGQQD